MSCHWVCVLSSLNGTVEISHQRRNMQLVKSGMGFWGKYSCLKIQQPAEYMPARHHACHVCVSATPIYQKPSLAKMTAAKKELKKSQNFPIGVQFWHINNKTMNPKAFYTSNDFWKIEIKALTTFFRVIPHGIDSSHFVHRLHKWKWRQVCMVFRWFFWLHSSHILVMVWLRSLFVVLWNDGVIGFGVDGISHGFFCPFYPKIFRLYLRHAVCQ